LFVLELRIWKGIGLEISKKLCSKGFRTIIACRNEQEGLEVVKNLRLCGYESEFRKVDISKPDSIDTFAEVSIIYQHYFNIYLIFQGISSDYTSIDVLVNNAGVAFNSADRPPFKEQAEPTLATNYFGTLHITQKLLPLLERSSQSPRIVNVASMMGKLDKLRSKELLQRFTSPSLALDELNDLMSNFINDVQSGKHNEKGWPNSCYCTSKLGVIAMTKVMARVLKVAYIFSVFYLALLILFNI